MSTQRDQGHTSWPMERMYWAVLETAAIRRPGELPIGLRQALEEEVPVPGDELHAVCAPAGDGTVVVCAALRQDLAAVDPDTLSLVPASLPDFVQGRVEPEALNLLVGALEPSVISRARRLTHTTALSSTLLCAGLLSLGLVRRAEHWGAVAGEARRATDSVLKTASAGPTTDALAMELSRQRRIAMQETGIRRATDASAAISSLLAAWPSQVPSKPQAVAVNETGMTVSVTVEGDPGAFLNAFKPPPGWTLDEPRLNTAGAITRLSLQLRRARGGRP